GVDMVIPSTLDRAWFYVYVGLSIGYSAGQNLFTGGGGSFALYAGLLWNIVDTSSYPRPFFAVSGASTRWGARVPPNAPVFDTIRGFGDAYGFSVTLFDSSPGTKISAAVTWYWFIGEVTVQGILDGLGITALEEAAGRLEYDLRHSNFDDFGF